MLAFGSCVAGPVTKCFFRISQILSWKKCHGSGVVQAAILAWYLYLNCWNTWRHSIFQILSYLKNPNIGKSFSFCRSEVPSLQSRKSFCHMSHMHCTSWVCLSISIHSSTKSFCMMILQGSLVNPSYFDTGLSAKSRKQQWQINRMSCRSQIHKSAKILVVASPPRHRPNRNRKCAVLGASTK